MNYRTELAPFEQNVEHSIKLLAGFNLGKGVSLSFRVIGSSGKPYTPQIIGTNSELDDSGCGTPPCDNGLVFVDDPARINAGRLPWTLTMNIRLDWVFYKSEIVEASLFIDVLDLQAAFYSNVTGFRYNRIGISGADPTSVYAVGDPAPSSAISENSGGMVLPVLGFEFKF